MSGIFRDKQGGPIVDYLGLAHRLAAYRNRAIATQEVIDELIQLAKEMQAATQRGEYLGLNEDEICLYDALAVNESAVQAIGNDEIKVIAAELVTYQSDSRPAASFRLLASKLRTAKKLHVPNSRKMIQKSCYKIQINQSQQALTSK